MGIDPSQNLIQIPPDFRPRDYQQPLWDFIHNGGKRGIAVWHRRAGKDLLATNIIASMMVQRPGVYWHMFPTYNQGKKIIWNGRTNTGRPFLNALPPELRESENANELTIRMKPFPGHEGGSVYQIVGADKPDSLVGSNPVGVVFSEFSLMPREVWTVTVQPILRANDGWAIFIFTPKGQNHAYELLTIAKTSKKWFTQILTIDDTKKEDGSPVVSKDEVQEDIDTGLMSEEKARSEYYVSFESPVEGSYFGTIMNEIAPVDLSSTKTEDDDKPVTSHVRNLPWQPALQVHTAWDLGWGDDTVIWYFQAHEHEIRWIACEPFNKKDIAFYAKHIKSKPYIYGYHFFPWDIEVETIETGRSRFAIFREHGINPKTVKRHKVGDRIEAIRAILRRSYFDERNCAKGIQALREYRAEWSEERQIFTDNAVHDWCSHYVDALGCGAMGFRQSFLTPKKKPKDMRIKDYDPLG